MAGPVVKGLTELQREFKAWMHDVIEFVIDQAPEVIIGAWGAAYDVARLLRLHPSWSNVPAVRNGRVHPVDPDLLLRPGPRLVEGTETITRILDAPGGSSP